MKRASPRGEVPSLSRRRGVTSCTSPSQSPYGDSSPQGEPSLVLRAIHLVPPRGASHMTCIGRSSLSLGRGAELVEAERGDIMHKPLSVALRRQLPPRGAFSCPIANSPCLPSKGRWLRALRADGRVLYVFMKEGL